MARRSSGVPDDPRCRALGLSVEEASYIRRTCEKYHNRRDEVEDLFQIALVGLFQAFEREAERGRPVQYRKGFIRAVVRNTLCSKVVRKHKRDLLYNGCFNSFSPIEDFGMGIFEVDYDR